LEPPENLPVYVYVGRVGDVDGCGDGLDVDERWTGREARALRLALRMTYIEFARYLGVHDRTVAYWHARPSIVPVPELQDALDTALGRAAAPARERFALLLAGGAA
jgi:8-oxo-dGTP diphosphatase